MNEENSWVNYAYTELGEFAQKIADLKEELAAAYAADAGVDVANVRVSLGRYGVGFLVVKPTPSKPTKTLGQGGKATQSKPQKNFGPRSPRLK